MLSIRRSKIIAGILVLIGFGSCCNRPAKSKVSRGNQQQEVVVDTMSVEPDMRVMYGPPHPVFRPEREVLQVDPGRDTTPPAEAELK